MRVGLIGIIVPLLPRLWLVWGAALLWAIEARTTAAWVVLGLSTALGLSGSLLRYVLPGRLMARDGVLEIQCPGRGTVRDRGLLSDPHGRRFRWFRARGLPGRSHHHGHPYRHAVVHQARAQSMVLSRGIEMLTAVAMATTWLIGVTAVG